MTRRSLLVRLNSDHAAWFITGVATGLTLVMTWIALGLHADLQKQMAAVNDPADTDAEYTQQLLRMIMDQMDEISRKIDDRQWSVSMPKHRRLEL